MPISLSKRPATLNWSKNAISYTFQYSLMNTSWKLELNVTSVYGEATVQYPFPAPFGQMTIYIQDILDAMVKYPDLPTLSVPQETEQVLYFGMKFRIVIPNQSPQPWDYDARYTGPFVVKGGIGDWEMHEDIVNTPGQYPNGFYPNRPGQNRFLTWLPNHSIVRPDVPNWMLYVSDTAVAKEVRYVIEFLDGTKQTITKPLPSNSNPDYSYRSWYVPCGIEQCRLDPMKRGIQRYTVNIGPAGGSVVSTAKTFTPDYRPAYDAVLLYYRNSVGGIDHVLLRGAHQLSADAARKEYRQNRQFPASRDGHNPWYGSDLRPHWRGHTGYLDRGHILALQDILLAKGAWMYNGRFLPVRITSQSLRVIDTQDALHSLELEFETAGTFDVLPRQMTELYQGAVAPVPELPSFDPDVQNFIDALLADGSYISFDEMTLLNNYVIYIKSIGAWQHLNPIYPFIGNNPGTHKWNLKDPRNTNAAHRLTFVGAPTHSDKGIHFNGISQYAETYLIPNGRIGFGAYVNGGTLLGGVWPCTIGSEISPPVQCNQLALRTTKKVYSITHIQSGAFIDANNNSNRGFYQGYATAGGIELQHNKSLIDTNANTGTSAPTLTLWIAGNNGNVEGFQNVRLGYLHILRNEITRALAELIDTGVREYITAYNRLP